MTSLAGIAALGQMTVLPGLVLLRYIGARDQSFLERLIFAFALSLVANTALVTVLVTLHVFHAAILWAVIAAELALLLLVREPGRERWRLDVTRLNGLADLSFSTALGGLLLFAAAFIFARLCYENWGTVFTANDEVASWDRWAEEWASGTIPTMTSFYPQLLPANWSLSYVLLGTTDIKLFAKATTPLYGLLTTLLFLDLAIRRRAPAYLFAGALFGLLCFHYLGFVFLTYGYADVPLAFFGALTLYALLRHAEPDRLDILMALIAALGAVLVKQGGVYAVIAALVFLLWRRRTRKEPLLRRDVPTVVLTCIAVFAAAWYAGKYIQIYLDRDYSNITLLTQGLHGGRSYGQRLVAAASMFSEFRGLTGSAVAAIFTTLIAASLFMRETRALTLFVLVPLLLLYGLFFSYEIRNASLAFPLIACVCAFPLERVARVGSVLDQYRAAGARCGVICVLALAVLFSAWVLALQPGASRLPLGLQHVLADPWVVSASQTYAPAMGILSVLGLVCIFAVRIEAGTLDVRWAVAVSGLALCLYGALLHDGDEIRASQEVQQRQIGDAMVNERLYRAVRDQGIHSGILTDYWFLRGLPGIRHLFRRTGCEAPCSLDTLQLAVKAYPDVDFVLMQDANFAPGALAAFDRASEFSTVFVEHGVRLLRVQHARASSTPPALPAATSR